MTSLVLLSIASVPTTALLCTAFARWMRHRSIGQQIRLVGPRSHSSKAGTPTMGGVIVLGIWVMGVLALEPWTLEFRRVGFILAAGGIFGTIGLFDDIRSILRRESTGITPLYKILLGSLGAFLLFFLFQDVVSVPSQVPFTSLTLSLPAVASFFLTWGVFLSTTNSMNLADGLDGLAPGLAILITCGLIILSPVHENLVVALPLLGALTGFLWTNSHPASLFLGDVGAFALGGVTAAIALSSGLSLLLPLLAGVLVLEAASVFLQIAWFKLVGRRLLKMSPLHHHFEASGSAEGASLLSGWEWPEMKVTVRFWLVQALFVAVGIWSGWRG